MSPIKAKCNKIICIKNTSNSVDSCGITQLAISIHSSLFHSCNTSNQEAVETEAISKHSNPAAYRLQFHQEQHCNVFKGCFKNAFIHGGLFCMGVQFAIPEGQHCLNALTCIVPTLRRAINSSCFSPEL